MHTSKIRTTVLFIVIGMRIASLLTVLGVLVLCDSSRVKLSTPSLRVSLMSIMLKQCLPSLDVKTKFSGMGPKSPGASIQNRNNIIINTIT
jgi:hypothetical protein